MKYSRKKTGMVDSMGNRRSAGHLAGAVRDMPVLPVGEYCPYIHDSIQCGSHHNGCDIRTGTEGAGDMGFSSGDSSGSCWDFPF